LNYAPQFSLMQLTQNPDGSSARTGDPPQETAATLTEVGQLYTLELANLEDYSVRDKIPFRAAFQVKRSRPDEEVWRLIGSLHKTPVVELAETPVQLIALTGASFQSCSSVLMMPVDQVS
jgi:hypothetical protein